MTLDELVTQLRAAYGNSLRSVVLYGSAVAGEHIAKRSDYNVLVVVDELPLDRLRALTAVTRAWRDSGNPPPMTFTSREWQSSADVFPMEYADVLERHRVLFGDDPFGGLKVERSDLRVQLEHEALGVLLRLRQGILLAGEDAGEQLKLMAGSLSSLMIVFRGLVRFHGRTSAPNYAELATEVAGLVGVTPEAFLEVIHHVRGDKPIQKERAYAILGSYLRGMEAVTAHIDALPTTQNQKTPGDDR